MSDISLSPYVTGCPYRINVELDARHHRKLACDETPQRHTMAYFIDPVGKSVDALVSNALRQHHNGVHSARTTFNLGTQAVDNKKVLLSACHPDVVQQAFGHPPGDTGMNVRIDARHAATGSEYISLPYVRAFTVVFT